MSFCVAFIMVPMLSNAAVPTVSKASEQVAEQDVTETTVAFTVESEHTEYLAAPPAETESHQIVNPVNPSGSATAEEERRKGEEYLAQQEAARAEREAHEALLAEYFTEDDVVMMAQLIDIEAGSVYPLYRRAAVGWTVLNRLDGGRWEPTTISGIISQDGQYAWYAGRSYSDVNYDIARDVLARWAEEKISGNEDPGRVLPIQYEYFYGDGEQNHFYDASGNYWDYGIEMDPYENW